MNVPRISRIAALSLTALLAAALVVEGLIAPTATANAAAPSAPFAGTSASFPEPPQEDGTVNLGDWGVAEKQGTASYNIPIDTAPGRGGMSPQVELRYSSGSPLRGGVAVGWSLNLPAVWRDRSLGIDAGTEPATYQGTLGSASGRLIAAAKGDAKTTEYRVAFDDTFTRFFRRAAPAGQEWAASDVNGGTHRFAGGGARKSDYWPISESSDAHGNTIRYEWSIRRYARFSEYLPSRIEYASNAGAHLSASARVDFTWDAASACGASEMPMAAAPAESNPWRIEGAAPLSAVAISVRDRPDGQWRLVKRTTLTYEMRRAVLTEPELAPGPGAPSGCGQGSLRYLAEVATTGYDIHGAPTAAPAMKFRYNHRSSSLVPSGGIPSDKPIPVPGFPEYGSSRGARGSLLDINSDGLSDRVAVAEVKEVCTLFWRLGLAGGRIDSEVHQSPLPTAPWHSPRLPAEACTFNGQISFSDRPDAAGGSGTLPSRGLVSYHFIDYTGDGRVDLLTNVWAEANHADYVPFNEPYRDPLISSSRFFSAPAPDDDPDPGGDPVPMSPEGSPIRWRVYRNIGDLEAWPGPASLRTAFSVRPLVVNGPSFRSEDCAPQPLPPSAPDNEVGQAYATSLPTFSIPTLFDIDGDGFLDLIDPGKDAKVLRFDTSWCVFFGHGGATFRATPHRWDVPKDSVLVGAGGFNETVIDSAGERHIKRATGAALIDMNGDGRADLVLQSAADRRLRAYANLGGGFSPRFQDLGFEGPVEVTQTDYAYTASTVSDGHRGYTQRLVDVDADGLVDLLSLPASPSDITATGHPTVRFNSGSQFLRKLALPDSWLRAARLFRFEQGRWDLTNDYYDITGDGHSDLLSWSSDGTRMTVAANPGLAPASDLLSRVDNGSGGTVRITYGVSTDRSLATWPTGPDSRRYLSTPTSLVRAVTASPGFGGASRTTTYSYADPVFTSAAPYTGIRERHRFAGFRTVSAHSSAESSAAEKRTTTTYDFGRAGAPEGRPITQVTEIGGGDAWAAHTYTRQRWKWETILDGKVTFSHATGSVATACRANTTPAQCADQTTDATRSEEVWSGHRAGSGQPVVLFLRRSALTSQELAPGDTDVKHDFHYDVAYGGASPGTTYMVRVATQSRSGARAGSEGTLFDLTGRVDTEYDPAGSPVETKEWTSASDVSVTRRTFDAQTGNLLSVVRPNQLEPGGSGRATTYEYDANEIFVRNTENELGHRTATTVDLGTGEILEQRGPNWVQLGDQRVRERQTWKRDGLGRVLVRSISFDDAEAGYRSVAVERATYFDLDLPSRVVHRQLTDTDTWVTTERTLDGFGHVLATSDLSGGGGRTALARYSHDGYGNVISVSTPDPRSDSAEVANVYAYDGAGRVVRVDYPDDSRSVVTYDALVRTQRRMGVAYEGPILRQEWNGFGQLTAVVEDVEGVAAATRYSYDHNGNLASIHNADGAVVSMASDWAGNRVRVTRDERTWTYAYDAGGNLTSALPPQDDADAALPNLYRYDDLDRIIEQTHPVPTSAVERRPDGTARVTYAYDEGRNGLGRLSAVDLGFATIAFTYDARGLTTSETREIGLEGQPSFHSLQSVHRRYGLGGQLVATRWDNGDRWRTAYDDRGRIEAVRWLDPEAGEWRNVATYERSTLGLPRARSSAYRQSSAYRYDPLGRVVGEQVASDAAGDVASRQYTYAPSGNLMSIAGHTAGKSAAATYTYDTQHRVKSAAGPAGYAGAFEYSPAGSIERATVRGSETAPRDVGYDYGDSSRQELERLRHLDKEGDFARVSYDAAGRQTERIVAGSVTAFTWDGLSRLRSAKSGAEDERYLYDHQGMRMLSVSKQHGFRSWFAERETHYSRSGTQTKDYVHVSDGVSTVARIEDGSSIELHYSDARGNLQVALSADGAIAARFLYGPFGEVVAAVQGETHRRQFGGKERDEASGMVSFGHRHYDPTTLRWSSLDPLYLLSPERGAPSPQSLNLYAFTLNNATSLRDPDGLETETDEAPVEGQTCELEPDECTLDDSDTDSAETSDSEPASNDASADNDDIVEGKVGLGGGSGEVELGNKVDSKKGAKPKSSGSFDVGLKGSLLEAEVKLADEETGLQVGLTATAFEVDAGASFSKEGIDVGVGVTFAEIEACGGGCTEIGGGWEVCGEVCGSIGVSVSASASVGAGGTGAKLGVGLASAGGKVSVKPPVLLLSDVLIKYGGTQ